MHYGENSIVLGENWRPYGRHFALKAQKKGPRNMRLREKKTRNSEMPEPESQEALY
jgi:hypothetical protein